MCGLAQSERLSGTVTFVFSDIEGSTSLLKQLGLSGIEYESRGEHALKGVGARRIYAVAAV